MSKVFEPLVTNSRKSISKHFRHYEVIRSETAAREEIDNQIYCPRVRYNAEQLGANVLDPVREHFGPYGPNSWFRGEDLERVIAGSGYLSWCKRHGREVNEVSWKIYFFNKQHPQGCAADIEIDGVSNDDLFMWIKDNLKFDQLIREFAVAGQPRSGWVHVSWDPNGKNRNQAFSIG